MACPILLSPATSCATSLARLCSLQLQGPPGSGRTQPQLPLYLWLFSTVQAVGFQLYSSSGSLSGCWFHLYQSKRGANPRQGHLGHLALMLFISSRANRFLWSSGSHHVPDHPYRLSPCTSTDVSSHNVTGSPCRYHYLLLSPSGQILRASSRWTFQSPRMTMGHLASTESSGGCTGHSAGTSIFH